MLDLTDVFNEFFNVLEAEAKVLQSHYDQYSVDISQLREEYFHYMIIRHVLSGNMMQEIEKIDYEKNYNGEQTRCDIVLNRDISIEIKIWKEGGVSRLANDLKKLSTKIKDEKAIKCLLIISMYPLKAYKTREIVEADYVEVNRMLKDKGINIQQSLVKISDPYFKEKGKPHYFTAALFILP